MVAEFATSIATTIFDHSLGAIVRHVGYLWNHKKNLADLKAQVKKLDNERDDKSHSVLVAQKDAKRIRSQVKSWQNNADKISLEARNIMDLYEENAKKRCLIGLCPNVVSHYRLGRKACKKQLEIVEAVTEANQFNGVADCPVQRALSIAPVEGFLTFDSRNSTLEKITETMKDATKNSIGLYGLGGMGKTTLAKQIASRAAKEGLFDEIVMALVTQKPELTEIQGEIAKNLGLKLEESSVAERAGRIHKRLKESKVLVILDDLWENLDLEKVGIPFGPEHKGCKLLLTSRSRDVLSSMGTKKDFLIGALEEEEAWRLFEEKTADVVKEPAFLDIGKKVAKRCKGLPVLIVIVAGSLSSRPSLHAWKDALKELKKMNNREILEIVNSALEHITYKHLQVNHKRLFLLCGLHGSDFHMSDMLKYCWGWNFFDEDVETLEEARNKLHTLILDLKASCLLLDGDDEDVVLIHDVVRGVAISLAQKDQNMLCVGDIDAEMIRWPADDVLRSCTAMVFNSCRDLPRLPERLECPLLELLYLGGVSLDASSTISDTYFQNTRELKVLDMTQFCFSRLPSTLSCLENLQTLCLDHCTNLADISIVGDLKKLQVLSLIYSDIKELPRRIRQLSELMLLDLTGCSKLEIIPAGLFAGLSKLEELYMRESFNRWEAEGFHGSNSERSSNVSLAELKHLPKLRSLEIEVEDAKLLSQDLNFERLERYRIIVGDMWAEGIDKQGTSRKLVNTGVIYLQNGVKELLKRVECLCLRELKGIQSVVDELDGDGFTDLKHLNIQTDYDIQFIINVELNQQKAFLALESLYLSKLSKLEKICNGRLLQDSFCKLTKVNVVNCNKLESLFSFSMATGLPCLQELQVSDCSILKGIVAKKSNEDYNEKIKFAQLRKLSLEGLPQLMSFCCGVKEKPKYMKTGVQSSEIVSEEEEPSSSMSFFKEVNFPSLENLSVRECGSFKYLFTPSVATGLVRLQVLKIESCMMMKEIVVKKEGETTDTIIFPQLSYLHFVDLPNLTTFYSGVEEMCSNENTRIVIQPLFNDKVNLPVLKRLIMWKLDSIKSIWHNHPKEEDSICRLEVVKVSKCAKLLKIFPSTMLKKIQSVKEIRIEDCEALEEVFEEQQVVNLKEITYDVTTVSLQLTILYLNNLPKLRFLWQKDFHKILSFENLCEVEIRQCESLKCVFPAYVAQRLHQLVKLLIWDCEGIETIVEDEGDENKEVSPTEFTFPKLTCLNLSKLPKVECLYPKKHASEWPLLNNLMVTDCDKISMLEMLDFLGKQQHNQFQKVLSNLEVLSLRGKDMKMMMRQYSEVFLKLRHLTLNRFDDGDESSTVFPSNFLYGLHKLASLTVSNSSFEEIFPYEGEREEPSLQLLLPHLKWLTLSNLPEMKYICTENSPFFPVLLKLELLHIIGCPGLTNVVPTASLSFTFLKYLTVTDCGGLIYVLPSSAAVARLENLQGLRIRRCEMIEEIVAADHHEEIIITFSQLRSMVLEELPRLTSFCTANNYNLEFPELASVTVRECSNMRTFSPGITITPVLRKVHTGWGKDAQQDWKGDLNTTIQHIFSEKEARRLTTTDPSTSSNNHAEPEAQIHEKPTHESLGKEAEEIREVGKKAEISENDIKPENEIEEVLTPKDPTTSSNNNIEPIESAGNEAENSSETTKSGDKGEVCENAVEQIEGVANSGQSIDPELGTEARDEEVIERGKVGDTCEKGKGKELEIQTRNHPFLESNIPEKFHSFETMPFYQHGESSLPTEQQSEKSRKTPVVEAGTSRSASNSQPKDFQILRITRELITLLSEFEALQTQPLRSMSAKKVQSVEDAFRDLSNMNFSIEWFLPYTEKARECLSAVERRKEISELELRIAETKAQLQALEESKKALEDKDGAFANIDLDKSLHDN